jgi:hypothetical protein
VDSEAVETDDVDARRSRRGVGPRIAVVAIALCVTVPAVVLAAVWLNMRTTWASVEAAAASFEVPEGFTEVEVLRQGSRVCFLICPSNDILVTRVLTSSLPDSVACARLAEQIDRLATDVLRDDRDRCGWFGTVDGSVSASGVVAAGGADFEEYGPAGVFGFRWIEATEVPDSPLVAWVEFSSPVGG